MKKTLSFTYGTETRSVELEESLLAADPIAPRPAETVTATPRDLLRQALAAPVERPRLRELAKGRRVAIIVSDEFRAGQHQNIIDVLLEDRDYIDKVFFYELRDSTEDGICRWGVLEHDFTRKPAYTAYQDYILAHPAP